MATKTPDAGLEGLADIDRLVHEPARLQILAHLYVLESVDFLFLLRHTGLTRGNLSSHVRKLEDAGYVSVEKKFVDRLSMTAYHLTDAGRMAFRRYRKEMLTVLDALKR